MMFLKNKKALTNWQRIRSAAPVPKELPCLAFEDVVDGYKFLYADDIFKLAMKFRAEIQP